MLSDWHEVLSVYLQLNVVTSLFYCSCIPETCNYVESAEYNQ